MNLYLAVIILLIVAAIFTIGGTDTLLTTTTCIYNLYGNTRILYFIFSHLEFGESFYLHCLYLLYHIDLIQVV